MPLKCCCGCTLLEHETFASDAIDIGAVVVESGTWAISGGKLVCSSSSGLVYFDNELPTSHRLAFRAQMSAWATGLTIRGLVSYQDDENYLYGESTSQESALPPSYVYRDFGACAAGSMIGSSDTTLDTHSGYTHVGSTHPSAIGNAIYYSPVICYREGVETLEHNYGDVITDHPWASLGTPWSAYVGTGQAYSRGVSSIGTKVGLSVSGNAGSVSFDNILVTRVKSRAANILAGCPVCACSGYCDEAADYLTVEPSDVNFLFTADGCYDYNTLNTTSYTANRLSNQHPCLFYIAPNVCTPNWKGMMIQRVLGEFQLLSVVKIGAGATHNEVGSEMYGENSSGDCITPFDIVHHGSTDPLGTIFDWADATVSVTPVQT